MVLPSAVRKAGEESDNAMKLAMKQAEDAKKEQEAGGDPGKQPAAAEKKSGDEPITSAKEEGEQANSEEKSWREAANEWKDRFTKYKANTDRTIHELRLQNEDFSKKVDQLIAAQQAAPPAPKEPLDPKSVLSDEERDDYSDEFIGVVGKVSSAAVERIISDQARIIEDLRAKVDGLDGRVKQVNEVSARTNAERFFEDLDAKVPSWENLQKDARFTGYMDKKDLMSGIARQTLLEKAFNEFDVERAARFYTAFAAEHGLPISESTSTRSPLQVVPDDSGAGDGGQNRDEKIYTQAEIDDFYHRMATNKKGMKMTDEELAAEEKRMYVAEQEGRVRK